MPPMGKKNRSNANAKAGKYTANQLFTGFMVVTMSFLVFAMWPESTESRGYDSMLTRMGIRRARVEVGCEWVGNDHTCFLQAKRQVQRGEKMFQIPTEAVMQAATIKEEPALKEILSMESEALKSAMQESGLVHEYFFQPFAVFFKIWHEYKMGSSSELYQWISMMPKQPNHGIYFSKNEAECLDKLTFSELNNTLTYAKNFANVVRSICAVHSSVYSCSYLDEKSLDEEAMWAFSMLQQRTWGEFRSPMFIPLVDFSFAHPDLCSPNGDKDVKCSGRDKQHFLIPQQEPGDQTLTFKSNFPAMKGDKLYSTSHNRAPWETLSVFGYADYAASVIPDLVFANRFQKFQQEHKLDLQAVTEDHPLKKCGSRQQMVWRESGLPTPELRACWTGMLYFTEFPHHLYYDEEARDSYKAHFDEPINKLKSKYLANRAMAASVQQIADYVAPPAGATQCDLQEGRLPIIKATYEISNTLFQRIQAKSNERTKESFAKWSAQDSTADVNVPEPVAQPKAVVEEDAATDNGDETDIQE